MSKVVQVKGETCFKGCAYRVDTQILCSRDFGKALMDYKVKCKKQIYPMQWDGKFKLLMSDVDDEYLIKILKLIILAQIQIYMFYECPVKVFHAP